MQTRNSLRIPTGIAAVLAAACGFAWQWGYAGPVLSLALIPLVLVQRNRWSRYAVALAYYLAGSHGIPLASAVFFGPSHTGGGHLAEGIALWLTSSASLAAGWAFADRPWKVVLVLLFDALIPPLAFFDWMSPLSAAGALFPGTGIVGLALLLLWIPLTSNAVSHPLARWVPLILLPVALNVTAWAVPHPAAPGIEGVNLHVGPSTPSITKNVARLQSWVAVADRHKKAKVLLLPETLLTWWPGNAGYVEQHVPQGRTWLVGASIPLKTPGLFADGIEAVTDHDSRRIFGSVLPVPVSMWRPWHKPTGDSTNRMDYKAFWWQKPVRVDGKTAWAEICYDQLLPFSWLEAALYHPEVVLLTNNEWWAKGTGIPRIQKASAWAWSRLIGAKTIEAENS